MSKIPGAPPPPALKDCANPTITGGFTTANAPLPSAADKKGAARAAAGSGSGGARTGGSGAVTQSDAATTDTTVAADAAATGDSGTIDAASAAAVRDTPISVSKTEDDVPFGIYVVIVILVLLLVFAPPAFAMALRKRR